MRLASRTGLAVPLASALFISTISCGSDGVVTAGRATSEGSVAATSTLVSAPTGPESEAPVFDRSLRLSLEGDNPVLIGTVLSVKGDLLRVSVDEVLSAGLHAKQEPDACVAVDVGSEFEVANTTSQFRNDLVDGDQALFLGQLCDGQMELMRNAPNARRVSADGTIDLGGGDLITSDEARKVAGRSFAPVPVAVDQLDLRATLTGDELTVEATGTSTARLGVTFCDQDLVDLTSSVQNYFGRCSLQTTDSRGNVAPDRLTDGRLAAAFDVSKTRSRPFDVVIFGEDSTGLFQVRGIARVE